MSKVEDAARRLERAIGRLEAAAAKLPPASGETRQLALELAEAKAESKKLRAVNEAVVNRLDGAIERLGAVLDG
jgi:hypothetical protein